MFNIKTTFVTAIALFGLITTASFAQAPEKGGRRGHKHASVEHRLARLDKALNLSEKQEREIAGILRIAQEELKEVRNNARLTPEQKKARMKEIAKATHAAMEKVLTPEQIKKLKALKHHKHEKDEDKIRPSTR